MDGEVELLGERIAEQAAHLDAATHRLLTDLREFDARGGWRTQGASSCAHWLSWRVGWDPVTARERVRVARKLGDFPLTDDALRRGEISYSKVRAILRVATAANEAMLLECARLSTAAELEKLSHKYALVQAHGKDPSLRDDEVRRYVRRRDTDDGMVKIEAVLHPEEAELVWTMLDHATRQLARQPGPGSPNDSAESATGTDEPVSRSLGCSAQPTDDSAESTTTTDELVSMSAQCAACLSGDSADSTTATDEVVLMSPQLTTCLVDDSADLLGTSDDSDPGFLSSAAYPIDDSSELLIATGEFVSMSPQRAACLADDSAEALIETGELVSTSPQRAACLTDDSAESFAVSDDDDSGSLRHAAYPIDDSAKSLEAPYMARGVVAAALDGVMRSGESTVMYRPAPLPAPATARSVSGLRQAADAARRAFNRADSLVAIAETYLRGDQLNRTPIDLMVTIPLSDLRAGTAEPAAVGCMGNTCISAEAARRLSCDAGVIEVVEDDHGVPLSVGRKRRSVAGSIKRALLKRDTTCTYPGCTHRIFLEAHHIQHWADGGETSLRNTTLLCTLHHRHVHEYGYRIEMGADQRPQFRDPRGWLVASVPARLAGPELGWPSIRAANAGLAINSETIACEWNGRPMPYGAVVSQLVTVDGLT